MKNIKSIILLILIVVISTSMQAQIDRSIQPKPGPAPEFKIGEYQTFTLKNGLKVIVVENHKVPRISYQLTVDVDPILEKDAIGFVAMTGDLMRSGTSNKSKIEIDEAVDFIGASFSTYQNGMYGLTLTKHKEEFLGLFADVLLNPSFPTEEIEKNKKQTISGLISSKTNPEFIAKRVGQKLRNGNHPYGEIGTEETIENITREHLVNYYESYYKPNTSYLVIVGDIKLKQAKKDAEKYFGTWEKGEVVKHEYQFPNKTVGTRVALIHKENAVQSYIYISYPVNLKVGDKDALPAALANDVLGSGVFSARLISNLREDKGYTYGAYSDLTKDPLVGDFSAYAQVSTDVTDDAVNQFIIEMNRMKNELVDDNTLDLFKTVRTGSVARSLEKPQTIARFAVNTMKYSLPADYYQKYFEAIEAISNTEIQSVSKKYIDPDQAIIVIVGDKEKIAESIKKYSVSGKVELYDMYGNPVKEDVKKSIPEGVTAESVIEKYISAIGGKEHLEKIQDVTMEATTSMQGMEIKQKTYKKAPNKYAMIMSMNGNVMQQQAFNGERGIMKGFGGEKEILGDDLENLKVDATLNAELKFAELGVKLTLESVETIEGKDTYKVKVVNPTGELTYNFYDVESGLLILSKEIIVAPQGEFTQMQSFTDYKEVEGVLYPYTITISGVQNLVLKVDSISINTDLSDDLF
ncbi:MAG: insulinase family protein [Bacteroidales bacterium]|nr:insulinase family protein [Bacteroidales bacterium]